MSEIILTKSQEVRRVMRHLATVIVVMLRCKMKKKKKKHFLSNSIRNYMCIFPTQNHREIARLILQISEMFKNWDRQKTALDTALHLIRYSFLSGSVAVRQKELS